MAETWTIGVDVGGTFTDLCGIECCLRVRRRMSFTTFSAEGFGASGFCLISTPWW